MKMWRVSRGVQVFWNYIPGKKSQGIILNASECQDVKNKLVYLILFLCVSLNSLLILNKS